MAEQVKLAVAINQGELALIKAALEGAGIRFCASTEFDASAGSHPDFFPVFVAEEDAEHARRALRDYGLDHTLTDD